MLLSDCASESEKYIFIFICMSTLLSMISGVLVFSNERKNREFSSYDLLGFLYIVFSGKPLNDTGRKWRPVFLLMLLISLLGSYYVKLSGICGA